MDYGPSLPPRLGSDHVSDQNSNASEEPSKKVSDRPKKHSHSHSRHEVEPRSASDQYNDESDDPRMSSTKPKKHADKSRHKVRSRYVSSSSEEDQSSDQGPYQFLRNWNTKLGKIFPCLTLQLPLPRHHLLAMLLLKSFNIA